MFFDNSSIINTPVYETLKDSAHCSICVGIIIDPQQCQSCDTCFCKVCIVEWLKKSKFCPMKCVKPTFKDSRLLRTVLSKLNFKCQDGCDKEIPYDDLTTHPLKCLKKMIECPCCKTIVIQNQISHKSDGSESIIVELYKEIEILNKKVKFFESTAKNSITFPNGTRFFKTPSGNALKTISNSNELPEMFNISFKFTKVLYPGHLVLGVSDKILNAEAGYLGGDLGTGNWGLAGNGSIGEEGKWVTGEGYKQGDIVTLIGKGSAITYFINGKNNTRYKYDLKKKPLFLTFSYYYADEIMEIVDFYSVNFFSIDL